MTRCTLQGSDYGNWVPTKFVFVPVAAGILFAGLAVLYPVLGLPAIPFLLISVYFLYARCCFSSHGGNLQDRFYELVLDQLSWEGTGRALDIGCGNGVLAIKLAKTFPYARITGLDSWGPLWDYACEVCEDNAAREGVSGRVVFIQGSAAALPFADESYDAAVSNLVFHEVKGVADKTDIIREALRVVRKGGCFAFQDLFMVKRLYGGTDELLAGVRSWGVARIDIVDTSQSGFIPKVLKLPFMLGAIGILYGQK